MLKPHEMARTAEICNELRDFYNVEVPREPNGPYGRTHTAIETYRRLTWQHEPPPGRALELLAELICLYSLGIVRGDGKGMTPWPSAQG